MSVPNVFCSHCGAAQSAAGAHCFILHCRFCSAATIVLGREWDELSDEDPQIPLPPALSFQEGEFGCCRCDARLNVEIVLRSASRPCGRCANLEGAAAAAPMLSHGPAALTAAEMAFLSDHSPAH